MKQKEYKISEQSFNNLKEINNALGIIETKGESTMIMANIRQAMIAILQQTEEIMEEPEKGE
jgi:hypothetical protein